jgi:hypothetical protein
MISAGTTDMPSARYDPGSASSSDHSGGLNASEYSDLAANYGQIASMSRQEYASIRLAMCVLCVHDVTLNSQSQVIALQSCIVGSVYAVRHVAAVGATTRGPIDAA